MTVATQNMGGYSDIARKKFAEYTDLPYQNAHFYDILALKSSRVRREVFQMGDPVGFGANLLAIISAFKDPKELVAKLWGLSRLQKVLAAVLLILIAGIVALVWAFLAGEFIPTITQVMLSDYSLTMNTGDVGALSATVLYSDNTEGSDVLWVSSNKDVVQVDENGQLSAMSAGSATVTAQAANRKSSESAECVVTVADPLKGYSISVQRTAVENYVYIYVHPEDDDITQITLYAQAPSGEVHTPSMGGNNLYHFYTETGTWTIYATLKSQHGTYEASKPEDFVTIEVNDVSPNEMDALLAGLPVI